MCDGIEIGMCQEEPRPEPEEGGKCPDCGEGVLYLPPVKGCTCHIDPPCSACVDNRLRCPICGWEDEGEDR